MRLGIRLREPTRSNRPVRVAQVCGTTDVMILLLVVGVTWSHGGLVHYSRARRPYSPWSWLPALSLAVLH